MPVLEYCKFENVVIKPEGAMPWTRSKIGFLALMCEKLLNELYSMAQI